MVGLLGRLMISRLNRTGNEAIQKSTAHEKQQMRPEHNISVDYYTVRDEKSPFADEADGDPLDESQQKAMDAGIKTFSMKPQEMECQKENILAYGYLKWSIRKCFA